MRRKEFLIKWAAGTVLVLLVMNLMLLANAQVEQEPEFFDDEDDGVVEDVQDESDVAAADETYRSPEYDPNLFFFADHFDNADASRQRWIKSQAKKDDIAEEIAKYDGEWQWEPPQRIVWKKDIGLVLKSKAKHAAIAAHFHKEFTFKDGKPLVVQYEVTMQEGQECGGSYIKLLSSGPHIKDLSKFNDKTPYTIMFGPDKCGNDHKMHFIFRHVNPINGSITEKHCNKPKDRLEEPFKDKLPHLYQLVVRPDNTFEIRIDHKLIKEGSLLTEFTPPVNPPKEIDDPADTKPKDWDEREKIPDPTAQKPEDWDDDAPPQIPDPNAVMPSDWLEEEPDMLPDPNAQKPEDWDTEIDGEWEPPMVDNPVCEKVSGCGPWSAPLIPNKEYKGKWRAPLIENPNYQGKWAARKIANPDYYEDLTPFKMTPISAIGIELWSMSNEILFDNIIVADDEELAKDFAALTFDLKRRYIDSASKTLWHRLMKRMNYKPGWWALYFVYLLIPAGCYVFYLYKRAKELKFLDKIVAYATENPWIWKVGLVVLIVPIAFAFYNAMSKGGSSKKKDSVENAKKTDVIQEDDEHAEADADADHVEHVKEKLNESSPKAKKADLNVHDDDETKSSNTDGNDDGGDDDDIDEDGDDGEEDDDEDENDIDDENEVENDEEDVIENVHGTTDNSNAKPRKRRVRKDES